MFTIGIFTTHLPYLAFVVFYALFFLFGIREDPREKLRVREIPALCELTAAKDGPAYSGHYDPIASAYHSGLNQEKAWFFFASEKEKFLKPPAGAAPFDPYLPNLFARPPPSC